jgi:hypothetical protein
LLACAVYFINFFIKLIIHFFVIMGMFHVYCFLLPKTERAIEYVRREDGDGKKGRGISVLETCACKILWRIYLSQQPVINFMSFQKRRWCYIFPNPSLNNNDCLPAVSTTQCMAG